MIDRDWFRKTPGKILGCLKMYRSFSTGYIVLIGTSEIFIKMITGKEVEQRLVEHWGP